MAPLRGAFRRHTAAAAALRVLTSRLLYRHILARRCRLEQIQVTPLKCCLGKIAAHECICGRPDPWAAGTAQASVPYTYTELTD